MSWVFALLMRTDIRSMNPGKAMAQATHAASCFSATMETTTNSPTNENKYNDWVFSTKQNFGTTLTFAIKENKLYEKVNEAQKLGFIAEIINDPTYPIKDMKYPMNTCGYIFCPANHPLLNKLKLHK